MTMQYRYTWSGKPTPWVDFEAGLVEFDAYLVEIREKPEFVPGYFRLKLHNTATVSFCTRDPNGVEDMYERVEVTSVD